jgi:hypothetical protein
MKAKKVAKKVSPQVGMKVPFGGKGYTPAGKRLAGQFWNKANAKPGACVVVFQAAA